MQYCNFMEKKEENNMKNNLKNTTIQAQPAGTVVAISKQPCKVGQLVDGGETAKSLINGDCVAKSYYETHIYPEYG